MSANSPTIGRWLTRSVIAIGVASLLSDACYELIIPLLPALIVSMGGGALALGAIEGAADGLAAAFKLWGGVLADRTRHRRAFAAGGYLGVGLLMPAIGLAFSIAGVFALRVGAWIFRGFRSPIRDTLLVDDTDPAFVNRAFGFQRALDTVGAVIGPSAAMLMVLAHVPLTRAIVFGFIPGLLAPVCYLFVRERVRTASQSHALHVELRRLPAGFKRFLLGAGVFGVGNFSTTLLVLVAMHAFAPVVGPSRAIVLATGLYVVHNLLQAGGNYPASVLSERLGSGRMLVGGFLIFGIAALLIATASLSITVVIIAVVLSSVANAILEPMEGTFATSLLPADRRGTGFGALAAINGIGDLTSSLGVGALWQTLGSGVAFGASATLCVVGAGLLLPLVLKRPSGAHA